MNRCGAYRKNALIASVFALLVLAACPQAEDSGNTPAPLQKSGQKAITAFAINGVEGDINETTITLVLPYGTSLSSLAPIMNLCGASSNQRFDGVLNQTFE